MKVYMDNSASTKVLENVAKEIARISVEDYGNPNSLHSMGRKARELIDKSRSSIADKLGIDANEIIFTASGSESNNLAIKGFLEGKKGNIVCSAIEHKSVLNVFKSMKVRGFEVRIVCVDSEGFIDLEDLKSKVDSETALVSIMYANNDVGVIQDFRKIRLVIGDVVLHSDCVQAVGKVDIDFDLIDMASFSGHKFHGPKGVGFLYLKKGVKITGLILGGGQEKDLRSGTENTASIVGMEIALSEFKKNDVSLRDYFISEVLKIERSFLNGPTGSTRLCNNIHVGFEGVEGESLLIKLDEEGICASTGSACSSTDLKPSHVLEAIGVPVEKIHGCLRFTLSSFNTWEEVDYVVKILERSVKELRSFSPLEN